MSCFRNYCKSRWYFPRSSSQWRIHAYLDMTTMKGVNSMRGHGVYHWRMQILKYEVKELIENKVLTFRRNISRVYISISRPCHAQGEGCPIPLVIPYPEENRKVWKTPNINISKANGLVLIDPVIASRKAKKAESSNKAKIRKSGKWKSSLLYPYVMVIAPIPFETPYPPNISIPP